MSFQRLRAGSADDFIEITQTPDLLLCVLVGAPEGEDVVQVFVRGLEEQWLRLTSRTIVDMRGYRGSIDWPAIKRVSELADWGSDGDGPPPVAFISTGFLFQFVAKIVSALFPKARFRIFPTLEEGLAWISEGRDMTLPADQPSA